MLTAATPIYTVSVSQQPLDKALPPFPLRLSEVAAVHEGRKGLNWSASLHQWQSAPLRAGKTLKDRYVVVVRPDQAARQAAIERALRSGFSQRGADGKAHSEIGIP